MRLTLCALLFLLPLPATAATLCDGLAAELKRGTVAPSHVLRQLADRSGSHIVIADASETVPPAYQLEAFGPARLSQLDDGTVALVSTQEGALCQQWAFFERRNGGDLTDILYHRHRETIASPPPDLEVVGLG